MILTTTNNIDGHAIEEYLGVTAGETITGINALKDFAAGLRSIVGGRVGSYEKEAANARNSALNELSERAAALGANAVVGIHFDYSPLGQANDMIMVTATGTAVRVN